MIDKSKMRLKTRVADSANTCFVGNHFEAVEDMKRK